MSQRGQQSTAHEYDKRDQCVHCGMYRVNVEKMSHECKSKREAAQDEIDRVAVAQKNLEAAEKGD